MKYTNKTNIHLALALWLARDTYDHHDDAISATALLKPSRELILSKRVEGAAATPDVSTQLKNRVGTAIHDSIERTWKEDYSLIPELLGYPQKMVDRILINPKPSEIKKDSICIYLEQRHFKTIQGYKISGKSDFVAEGEVADFKTTTTWHYVNDTKTDKFRKQGSIYRLLNPEVITADTCSIHWIFLDWKAFEIYKDDYPKADTVTETYKLMSLNDTEEMVLSKLNEITSLDQAPDDEIPECTPQELWIGDPTYKYYKDPANAEIPGKRSTKNFTTATDAETRLREDGNVGKVIPIYPKAKACNYCSASPICRQRIRLQEAGMLETK